MLPDDFREFLQCLNARDVRYLIVGGHAVSFHGYPRLEIGEAWQRRVQGLLDGVVVSLISKLDLIANKRAVGRPEDLADIARLHDE